MATQTEIICPPQLSTQTPEIRLERVIALTIENLFKAWTTQLDLWFASPGSLLSKAEPNTAFYFETQHDGKRMPHYGRFLRIECPNLVEFTWVTGEGGTAGAETLVTITLQADDSGVLFGLTHAGFSDHASMQKHLEAWPHIIDQMIERRSRPVD